MLNRLSGNAFRIRFGSDRQAIVAGNAGYGDLDDLAWPVTTGDCAILITLSIAALIAAGTLAAWLLVNIISIG